MPFIDELVARLPAPVRRLALKHNELIKFALVGGTTFVFDLAIFYLLTFTILEAKPVVARVISGTAAMILSYVLNREWAFRNRGGRERSHEALLFFVISGIGVVLASAPLWLANNVFDMRTSGNRLEIAVLDFVLGFVIGNLLQMAFRFWALRKFAFPEEKLRGAEAGSTDVHPTLQELNDEELGHA
ncbi:GtrA family protein [Gordonia sp. NPDC003424]